MKLLEELRRRNVFRVALGYVIAGWLALQVTDVVMGLLELPSWVGRLAFFAVLLGFPLALAFSWIFQLTPEGLRRDSKVATTEVTTVATGRKLDLCIGQVINAHIKPLPGRLLNHTTVHDRSIARSRE